MAKPPNKQQNPDDTAPTGSGPLKDIDGPKSFIGSDEDAPIIIKPGTNEIPVKSPSQDRTTD